MLDLGHIHDILVDAKDDERLSKEARQSAKELADILNNYWNEANAAGMKEAKE